MKGQYSNLPLGSDLAEQVRAGETTVDQLAEIHGVHPRTIQKRLHSAGFAPSGRPSRGKAPRRSAAEGGLIDGPRLRIPEGVELSCTEQPDAWFPDEFTHATHVGIIKRICDDCPIRVDCLEFAVAHPEIRDGIWGGLTPRQITRLRNERGAA